MVLHLRPAIELTEDQFFALCQQNRDVRIERTAEGDLVVIPPTGWRTGVQNAGVIARLRLWAEQERSGITVDSSTGFTLPNGATRSPDAAWVRRTRLAALSSEQKERFLPLCPDFVIELRSPSDPLSVVQAKMHEYIANGARLGWLIDPIEHQVYVYRPSAPVQRLDNPAQLSGEPLLPGFVLDLAPIWDPDI